jgi:hypothetical protein
MAWLAETQGGAGAAGEGEVGGDPELQGPHGRREDDVEPPDRLRLRRQVHAGNGGRVRLKELAASGVCVCMSRVFVHVCPSVRAMSASS